MKVERLARLPTLNDCVHCGLCVPACPTYLVTGKESESPRGRIATLRAVSEQRVPLTPALKAGLEDCLVCRACESACPSGISMEALMAGYREEARAEGSDARTRLERWFLRAVLPHPSRLAHLTRLLRVSSPLIRMLGLPLEVPAAQRLRRRRPLEEARPPGRERGTVVLFRGCIADHWFRDEACAAQRVLVRNGWRVVIPEATCCGALHRHAGLSLDAARHERASAEALLAGRPDHVVVDAAACAAALAECESSGDAACAELAACVVDTPTLLWREGWDPPRRPLKGNWMVAPPCHHRHGPIGEDGLRAILAETLENGYQELPGPEHCCGAAGLYVMRRPGLSRSIGAESLRRFQESGAFGIITGNPGCQMRWETLIDDPPGDRVLHPVVAVDRAYGL